MTVQADISEAADVARAAQEVVDHFGRVDVLINNVGDMAVHQMSWRELTPESIDHSLSVDIKGTMLMTHEFGRRMLDDQQSGVIVNIGSRVVVEGSPRAPQYAAAKYAIIGISKSYAHALAPYSGRTHSAPASSRPKLCSTAKIGRRAGARRSWRTPL